MEEFKKEVQEFLTVVKDGKTGIEEHRKLTHWAKGLRLLLETEKQEDVRKKIDLFRERLNMILEERYGKQIPDKS